MRVVFAKSTMSVAIDTGQIVRLQIGEPWNGDDPVVKQHPAAFSDSPVMAKSSARGDWEPVIEQATAAPGEKRKRA